MIDHRPRFRREARTARLNEITLTIEIIWLECQYLFRRAAIIDWLNEAVERRSEARSTYRWAKQALADADCPVTADIDEEIPY